MTKKDSARHFVATWPKNRYLCGMTHDHFLFRPAAEADLGRIMEIIRAAQARMRARGRRQRQNGSPPATDTPRASDGG